MLRILSNGYWPDWNQAACNAAVLLQGETGTGKELATEYIHRHSTRHGKPFVVVDCTVLTQELCESELFGHEKGAFTGSAGNRKGLFETADGRTLFLDELGEMPLSLQAKLWRALDNGSFRRVGSSKSCYCDVRVVCATNRDLSHMVKMGHFRQDLFYQVGVFPIRLPPLRERRDDIPMLVQALLLAISAGTGALYRISQLTEPGVDPQIDVGMPLASRKRERKRPCVVPPIEVINLPKEG